MASPASNTLFICNHYHGDSQAAMIRVSATRLMQQALRTVKPKAEGDISSVFSSLSNEALKPLPDRYVHLKRAIVGDKLPELYESWKDLLKVLEDELQVIKQRGNTVIPIIDFKNEIAGRQLPESTLSAIRHRGICVVRNVFDGSEALGFKSAVIRYIKANPNTKAFPADDPQVFELYWSPSQIVARSDSRMLAVQRFFLSLWHQSPSETQTPSNLSTEPLIYADRLRIRRPGDAKFALGPHVDGGSVERWEDSAYRSCYAPVFEGRWKELDLYDLTTRASANMSLHETAGGCSMFRAWQGWLSMSETGPNEGTLRVLPLTTPATAYWLLRPFFSPSAKTATPKHDDWIPNPDTPYLHGSTPGRGHELNHDLHPHLELEHTMVSMPKVYPGDVVMWHADLIHAVESVHRGSSDSSVMYIPAVSTTPKNLEYLALQKESFLAGLPPPDFPGGQGEASHIGRGTRELIEERGGQDALRAMGF